MTRRAVLVAAMMLLAPAAPGTAAELGGVVMPELRQAAGTTLRLNGMGTRLYSVFRVTVYVAGLYLERPSSSADAILRSPEVKLIEVRSLHSVRAGRRACRLALRLRGQLPATLRAARAGYRAFLGGLPGGPQG